MRTCYVLTDERAIADLVRPGELTRAWTITRINVPEEHRRQGVGQRLLAMILQDADAEGAELWLEPSPSGGPDYDDLVAWYVRNGFRMTSLGYMRRKPQ